MNRNFLGKPYRVLGGQEKNSPPGRRNAGSGFRRRLTAPVETLERREFLAGDLVGHWRADSLNETVMDGAAVTRWPDLVQGIEAVAEGQPTFHKNVLGGRSALRFDPSDGGDVMVVGAGVNPMSDIGDFTVAVTFLTDSNDFRGNTGNWFENTAIVDSNTLGFGTGWGISVNAAGQVAAGVEGGFGQPITTLYANSPAVNDGEVRTVYFRRSGGQLQLSVDDTAGVTRDGANTAPRGRIDLIIGGLLGRNGLFTGDIAELRIYDGALTDSELSSVRTELNSYYRNSAPIAVDDRYVTQEDNQFFLIPAPGVLSNDVDADGDSLTVELVDAPQHGNLVLRPNGEIFYNPAPNFFGTDTFTYRAVDFRPSAEPATVTIEVEPRYDPAQAVADSYKARPNEPLIVSSLVGLLANDVNIDQAPLTAVLATDVTAGSLQLNNDGSFRYDPQGFSGSATFTYRINDQTQLSPPATVTLIVNTPPEPQPDTFVAQEDTTFVAQAVAGLLANDVDADGNTLVAQIETAPNFGQLLLNPDGAFTYIPSAHFFGEDQFTYRVTDGVDLSEPVSVRLQVQSVNDIPVAQPDFYFSLPDTSLQIPAAQGLLANDSDIEGGALTAALVQNVREGQLQLNQDGSFRYTPRDGFVGVDQFSYRANDGQDSSAPVEVTLTVTDRPVIISEIMASNAGTLETMLRPDALAEFEGEQHSPDWIELQNILPAPVDLGGMYLTDDLDDLTRWQFPAGTIIPPSGHLVVFASGFDIKDPALDQLGFLHTNFALSSSGEPLALVSADGKLLYSFGDQYPEQRTHISFGLTEAGDPQYYLAPTPGAANGTDALVGLVGDLEFSVTRDFFDAPFQLQITSPNPAASIRYTIDGSVPTQETGIAYSQPISIDGTTTVRARAFLENYVPSNVGTQSYFFLADVVEQDRQATLDAGFPTTWRGNAPDYGFDSDDQLPLIAGDRNMSLADAKNVLQDSLQSLPTLSIVMNIDDMFGQRGIYSNPTSAGPSWERQTSVEWLNPDGSEGFQIDAGIRIQGGAFRGFGLTSKKSFRLLFKNTYGPGSLQYPVFGEDATSEFTTLTLRMESNDGWQWDGAGGQPQYARDEYLRRTQLAMGQPASHGRNVHLYINGFYWGMYNVVERPDESFGEAYLGSYPYDWDGTNSGTPINADGDRFRASRTRNAWRDFLTMMRDVRSAETEEARTAAYFRAQGLRPDGTDDPDLVKFLDPINYADYMIANFYGGNADWPFKNFYYGRENSPDSDGYKFFMWDAEWSLFLRSNQSISLINDAREVGRPLQDLRSSAEFRLLFADRVHKHLFNGGALYVDPDNPQWDPEHPERNVPASIYHQVTREIYGGLIAESARWGDQHRAQPYTRDVEWQREYDRLMSRWFPTRTQELLGLFRRAELYPDLNVPLFSQRGGTIASGSTITLNAAEGEIYYTLDGSDPRQIGGAVSPSARRYTGPIAVGDGVTVTVRGLLNDEWSAIDQASFAFPAEPASAESLRLGELHYNPGPLTAEEQAAGFADKDEFEFLELVNISSQVIDLANVELRQQVVDGVATGLGFRFAEGAITRLAPGERVLVVENLDAFNFRYGNGLPVAGQWVGGLSNASETVQFFAGDSLMYTVTYQDDWHASTDGDGFSLEIIDIAAADLNRWNEASAWRPSQQFGGTPGTDSDQPIPGDSNGDGRFDSSDLVSVFQAGEYEDDVAGNSTFAEGDWNGDGDFTTRDLVFAFQQGNYIAAALADELLKTRL